MKRFINFLICKFNARLIPGCFGTDDHLYNLAIDLFKRDRTKAYLVSLALPQILLDHEVREQMEPGITGMYD